MQQQVYDEMRTNDQWQTCTMPYAWFLTLMDNVVFKSEVEEMTLQADVLGVISLTGFAPNEQIKLLKDIS